MSLLNNWEEHSTVKGFKHYLHKKYFEAIRREKNFVNFVEDVNNVAEMLESDDHEIREVAYQIISNYQKEYHEQLSKGIV